MAGPEEEREFRLGWSLWRRAHQALAKRCHTAKRDLLLLRARVPGDYFAQPEPAATAMPLLAPMPSRLTDVQWARIEALVLPNGGRGRRWRDHRTVIDGMLWVHASGASWRDLPEEEFGPWQTIYDRYNRWRWRKEGLWQQIAELLRCQR
jgi:transposase